jgi:hypothetical protein
LIFRRALAVAALRLRSREFKELEIVVLRVGFANSDGRTDLPDLQPNRVCEPTGRPFTGSGFARGANTRSGSADLLRAPMVRCRTGSCCFSVGLL